MDNPKSYVMLLGETSSGKSTILNGLLGCACLPAASSPTTGEVVEIEENKSDQYFNYFGVLGWQYSKNITT